MFYEGNTDNSAFQRFMLIKIAPLPTWRRLGYGKLFGGLERTQKFNGPKGYESSR